MASPSGHTSWPSCAHSLCSAWSALTLKVQFKCYSLLHPLSYRKIVLCCSHRCDYHSHHIIYLRALGLLSCSSAFLRSVPVPSVPGTVNGTGQTQQKATGLNSFLHHFKCSPRNNNYLVISPPGTGGFYYHVFHGYFKHLYFKPYYRFSKFSFDDISTWLCY